MTQWQTSHGGQAETLFFLGRPDQLVGVLSEQVHDILVSSLSRAVDGELPVDVPARGARAGLRGAKLSDRSRA